MHITCERCGTVYTLDDRLIPAAGAPVQCTRCGNVFTAKAPGAAGTAKAPDRSTLVQYPADPVANRGEPARSTDDAAALSGRTMMQYPAAAPRAPNRQPEPPASKSAATTDPELGRTMMQYPASAPKAPLPSSERPTPRPGVPDPSLGKTMMQFPADAVKAPPRETPPDPKPQAPKGFQTPSPNRTLVQFPAVTAPPPGTKPSPRTMRFGATPQPTTPPTTAPAPHAPEPTPLPKTDPPLFPKSPQPASRAYGSPQSGSDAMAKTILGAPAFTAPPLPVFENPPPSEEPLSTGDLEFEAKLKNRGRRPLMLVAGAAVFLAVVGGIYAFLQNRQPAIPPAALREQEDALRLMKHDDTESLTAAADRFAQLSLQYPAYSAPSTDRIMALALLEADLREKIRVLETQYNKLDKERDALEKKQETADWRQRVQEKIDGMKAVKAKADPLGERAEALSKQLTEQMKLATAAVKAKGSEDSAFARAAALHYALKGDPRAEKDAETYLRMSDPGVLADDPKHAYTDLAIAVLAAYGPHNEDRVAKGRKAAHDALAKDSSLLRAQFALAKIALGMKEYADAKAALDALFIQNPKHDAGLLLREEIEASEAADAALRALRQNGP